MGVQNYKNHIRYYVPHHFIFYPLMLLAIICCTICIFHNHGQAAEWAAITVSFVAVTCLSFMMRQHYALNNQNRIVRLEMRFRYYVLTHQRLEPLEQKLSFGQLAALRFASDEELPALLERTLKENLSPDSIKRSISNWQPDYMRV